LRFHGDAGTSIEITLDDYTGAGTYKLLYDIEASNNHRNYSDLYLSAVKYSNKYSQYSDDYKKNSGSITIEKSGNVLSGTFNFTAKKSGDEVEVTSGAFTSQPR
jgi:hypothetical protein